MDAYVTGSTIKKLREERKMTQSRLAELIGVSDKAVSRWETGKGFPDITLIEPIASSLGISVTELFMGNRIMNKNISANMLRTKFYICPICNNVIHSVGDAVVSCCGISLPAAEAEQPDEQHMISVTPVEDEFYVTLSHDMTKQHYITFIAYATADRLELIKLYPESNPEARFFIRGSGTLYWCCNRHGLMSQKIDRRRL